MSDISLRTERTYLGGSHRWVGRTSGLEDADSITLDGATLDRVTAFPNGFYPSGLTLGKITATGLYGPYDDTASDGRQTAVGFLAEDVPYDRYGTASAPFGGALMWWGEVVTAYLPPSPATGLLDAAGKTDLAGKFRFI